MVESGPKSKAQIVAITIPAVKILQIINARAAHEYIGFLRNLNRTGRNGGLQNTYFPTDQYSLRYPFDGHRGVLLHPMSHFNVSGNSVADFVLTRNLLLAKLCLNLPARARRARDYLTSVSGSGQLIEPHEVRARGASARRFIRRVGSEESAV